MKKSFIKYLFILAGIILAVFVFGCVPIEEENFPYDPYGDGDPVDEDCFDLPYSTACRYQIIHYGGSTWTSNSTLAGEIAAQSGYTLNEKTVKHCVANTAEEYYYFSGPNWELKTSNTAVRNFMEDKGYSVSVLEGTIMYRNCKQVCYECIESMY